MTPLNKCLTWTINKLTQRIYITLTHVIIKQTLKKILLK